MCPPAVPVSLPPLCVPLGKASSRFPSRVGLLPLRKRVLSLLVVAVCFVAIAVLRWPLLPVMLTLAPISILLHARFRK